ncbi:MAG: antitoxin family protein [Pseudomonadota bacterium]
MKTIKARFSRGKIEPLEKVDIEEGEEITLSILVVPSRVKKKSFLEALKTTAGGWKNLIDCDDLKKNIYSDRLIVTRPGIDL